MRGVPFNVGLGAYPLVTLAKARRMSIDNARLVADGTDPRAERKRDAGIPTFKEASETVVGIHAQTWQGRDQNCTAMALQVGGICVSDCRRTTGFRRHELGRVGDPAAYLGR